MFPDVFSSINPGQTLKNGVALFMSNADEFSELIRNGSLDFALLKPIDTQFLVSLQRIDWSALAGRAEFFAAAKPVGAICHAISCAVCGR